MNTLLAIVQLIPAIIAGIKALETAIPNTGAGAAKLDALTQIIQTSYDAGNELVPIIQKTITILVGLFNQLGIFKKAA